jgi:hypothetical protein
MTDLVQIVATSISAALLVLVMELVRRRKLTEEYSLLWFLCATALLGFSLWRDALHLAARLLGIYYPPAVLILVLGFFVFIVSLYFSVVVSRQRQQIERMVEDLALLDRDLRDLRARIGPLPSEQVVPGAADHRREPRHQRRVG